MFLNSLACAGNWKHVILQEAMDKSSTNRKNELIFFFFMIDSMFLKYIKEIVMVF